MIVIPVEPIWLDIAYDQPETLNNLSVNKNSSITGKLGELAVCSYFADLGLDFSYVDVRDFDILVNNKRIDVKSSRAPHYRKKEDDDALVTTYLRNNQDCDYYVFCCVDIPKEEVSLMGWCTKEWFWNTSKGKDYKTGQKVHSRKIKKEARLLPYKYLLDV
tara:strand:+ start:1062 stop:1544 length:483 start_codon:yes stop_codon:yes gene_type:complete